jgi:hypothetical protein
MADFSAIAKKMERAVRNGTGTSFTPEEMQLLLSAGIFDTISALKIKEMRSKCADRVNADRPVQHSGERAASQARATSTPPTHQSQMAAGIRALVAGR